MTCGVFVPSKIHQTKANIFKCIQANNCVTKLLIGLNWSLYCISKKFIQIRWLQIKCLTFLMTKILEFSLNTSLLLFSLIISISGSSSILNRERRNRLVIYFNLNRRKSHVIKIEMHSKCTYFSQFTERPKCYKCITHNVDMFILTNGLKCV